MDNAWKWLARILNLKPRGITPQLLHVFLEIAGHEFLNLYQMQARKVIQFIYQVYIPIIPDKAIAAKTRLQLFIEETMIKTSNFPKMAGSKLNP